MTSAEASSSPYAELERRLGHVFQDRRLVADALTHKSWLNERPEPQRSHNERLEFLGDAVLALVMSDLLMRRFPDQAEGELSKQRAALVNEGGLAGVAETLDLGAWIFLGRGEEQAGGRQKRSILANTLEALIGAVYLDGGFSAAHGTAERLFLHALAELAHTPDRDFKSRVQEIAQARLHLPPTYEVVAQDGPEHDLTFEVVLRLGEKEYGRARGKSKKAAQQNAAARALELLEGPDTPAPALVRPSRRRS
jgi:ribonuclease-3